MHPPVGQSRGRSSNAPRPRQTYLRLEVRPQFVGAEAMIRSVDEQTARTGHVATFFAINTGRTGVKKDE
jgi:hypothetical protein